MKHESNDCSTAVDEELNDSAVLPEAKVDSKLSCSSDGEERNSS